LVSEPGEWTLEFTPAAAKELKKLGREPAARILKTLENRIATLEDPRDLGKPLVGDWTGFWRWRMGDHRVIAKIEDQRVVIVIVRVAHRREVY
jgi:mRNA interferase RelE/StbE